MDSTGWERGVISKEKISNHSRKIGWKEKETRYSLHLLWFKDSGEKKKLMKYNPCPSWFSIGKTATQMHKTKA